MVCFYEIPLQNSNYSRTEGNISNNNQEAVVYPSRNVGFFEENKENSTLVNATETAATALQATDENKSKMSVNHVSTDAFK